MPAGVSAVQATALTTIGFFAITVFGLGAVSVVTDAEIIAVPEAGQAPGIVGMVFAVLVFGGVLYLAVRITRPKFRSVWTISIATAFVHMLAAGIGALVVTGDFVNALAVMGELITGGASLVILATGAIAGWAGIALRRTRAKRPRWPWERDDLDEN